MAIADLNTYKTALISPRQEVPFMGVSTPSVLGRVYDLWTAQVPAGVAPTTAVVPTRTTVGALGQLNPVSGQLSIIGAKWSSLVPGMYLVCDRLSHQGGLSGTATGAQTTNFPTAALTRYTSGIGVMMGLTIYTTIGTTATTVTASYTNTTPTAGRVTTAVILGSTGFREGSRMVLLPLLDGDLGVTSVQSVTLAATTGTAGAFGVTLFKPLYAIIVDNTDLSVESDFITGNSSGGIPIISDDSCLFLVNLPMGTNTQATGNLILAEN